MSALRKLDELGELRENQKTPFDCIYNFAAAVQVCTLILERVKRNRQKPVTNFAKVSYRFFFGRKDNCLNSLLMLLFPFCHVLMQI